MAKKSKYEVDTSEYDETKDSVGYDGDEPKKGIYDGKLVSLKEHTSGAGNEGLEWIFEISKGPYKGWRGWVYSNMDTAKWKTEQTTLAIQGGKKGRLVLQPADEDGDGKESPTIKKAKPVRLAVRREQYEGEPKAKIRTVLPLEKASSTSDDDDDPFADD